MKWVVIFTRVLHRLSSSFDQEVSHTAPFFFPRALISLHARSSRAARQRESWCFASSISPGWLPINGHHQRRSLLVRHTRRPEFGLPGLPPTLIIVALEFIYRNLAIAFTSAPRFLCYFEKGRGYSKKLELKISSCRERKDLSQKLARGKKIPDSSCGISSTGLISLFFMYTRHASSVRDEFQRKALCVGEKRPQN